MARKDYPNAVRSSALWAAYGDALGFISELTSPSGLVARSGISYVERSIPWTRRVGGRFGTEVPLPPGCYSDDTQLRLATSRAIRGDGSFDIEAFSKIELPVWLGYALGAGIGTKAAASGLSRSATWTTNFYHSDRSIYVESGGNGAVMRIQPHVWQWAARAGNRDKMLLEVFRNSIVTHGHPRAFVGACLHALTLEHCLTRRRAPDLSAVADMSKYLTILGELVRKDDFVRDLWLPLWEDESKESFESRVETVLNEIRMDLGRVNELLSVATSRDVYRDIASEIGALSPREKGSGTKTAILSCVLAILYERDPHRAVVESANLLESDTDTIGSVAGALLGAVYAGELRDEVQDREYLIREADRISDIGLGRSARSFEYPDLLHWVPPKTQLDVVAGDGSSLRILGLGEARPIGSAIHSPRKRAQEYYQWVRTHYGQSLLVKRRSLSEAPSSAKTRSTGQLALSVELELEGSDSNSPSRKIAPQPEGEPPAELEKGGHSNSDRGAGDTSGASDAAAHPLSVDALTDLVIRSDFDRHVLGDTFILIARQGRIEDVIGFSAIVAKAIRVRMRRNGR